MIRASDGPPERVGGEVRAECAGEPVRPRLPESARPPRPETCSRTHVLCPRSTTRAARAPHPSGNSSTKPGTISSPPTKSTTATRWGRCVRRPSPPSAPSSDAATSRDPPRRRFHPRPRFRLRPRPATPGNNPLPKKSLAQRSGRPRSRPTLDRMNLATTESHPRKSGSRSSTGSLLHPFPTPRSPHTPSLPDARPSSERLRCGERKSKFLAACRT
jgi:hypothetical protein